MRPEKGWFYSDFAESLRDRTAFSHRYSSKLLIYYCQLGYQFATDKLVSNFFPDEQSRRQNKCDEKPHRNANQTWGNS